jgi:hypothetical protein
MGMTVHELNHEVHKHPSSYKCNLAIWPSWCEMPMKYYHLFGIMRPYMDSVKYYISKII